jgi:hypothetical protein
VIRAICLGLTTTLLAAAALAAPATKPLTDIMGAWRFETEVYGDGCKLTGALRVNRAGQNGPLTCRVVATETCRGWRYVAEQACTVARQANRLSITNVVTKVRPASATYQPDDFELTVESPALMTGTMTSVHSAPVRFWRQAEAVS